MNSGEDINDAFDSITFSEDRLVKCGFQEGFEKGRIEGEKEGFVLGCKKGSEVGQEIGFYQGFAEGWIAELKAREEKKSEKVLNHLEKLLNLSQQIPRTNSKDQDIGELLGETRAKFKSVCSMLKVNSEFNAADISW